MFTLLRVISYTRNPGGRRRSEGPGSGEEFRDLWVIPALREASGRSHVLMLDMDGVKYYPAAWLDEVFGGLVRRLNLPFLSRTLRINSKDDRGLESEISGIMLDAANPVQSPAPTQSASPPQASPAPAQLSYRDDMIQVPMEAAQPSSSTSMVQANTNNPMQGVLAMLAEGSYVIPGKKVGDIESPAMHVDKAYTQPSIEEVTLDGNGNPLQVRVKPANWPPKGESF